MKSIDGIIKRLLNLSELIMDEIDILADLSYYDQEDTPNFNSHVESIASFLNSERVILNNLSIDELKEIYEKLPDYDNDTDEFDRCSVNISDKLAEVMEKNNIDYLENDNFDEEKVNDNETEDDTEEDICDKYVMAINDSQKNVMYIVDNIATVVIKKMLDRINSTSTDNKKDDKYKKRLIRYFNKFKYYFFKLDINLEYLGVKYRFDVNKIPMPIKTDIQCEALSNNECITLLERLYKFKDSDFDLEDMSFGLFNMMLFEKFLDNLSVDAIDNLKELCQELKNKYGDSMYGDIAYKKLICKKN